MKDLKSFWSWTGRYIGYRVEDSLFSHNGQQLGYFAEGDEVYGCNGEYLGEVRTSDRLITNPKKKTWTRRSIVPGVQKSAPGYSNVNGRDMLANYEDFPTAGDELGILGQAVTA